MNLTDARSYVRNYARNAKSSTAYSDAMVDQAIAAVGNKFVRETKCTRQRDTVDVTSGDATVDFSDIATFRNDLLLDARIDSTLAQQNLIITDVADVRDSAYLNTGEAFPLWIGFDTPTSAELWPTPNADYTLIAYWYAPFTTWTLGTATPNAVTLNIPEDLIIDVLMYGAASALQSNEPEHGYTETAWAKFLAHITASKGLARSGVQVVQRRKEA